MANRDSDAFILSGRILFKDKPYCYLWTLTFADNLPAYDVRQAMVRFANFVKAKGFTGRKCLRVIEAGSENLRLHFHLATPDRWDVATIRKTAQAHGFGRINVVRKPAKVYRYLSKYLRKQLKQDLGGVCRKWACVGFKGVPKNAITYKRSIAYGNPGGIPLPYAPTVLQFEFGDPSDGISWCCRLRTLGVYKGATLGVEEIKIMRMTDQQCREAIAAANQTGDPVVAGEYRGFSVTTKDMLVKGAKLQAGVMPQAEKRVILSHMVQCGTKMYSIDEFLPPGASDKPEDIKTGGNVGDPAALVLTSIKTYGQKTYYSGKLVFLSTLPLKEAGKK